MNRQELQEKLDSILVGMGAYNMFAVCDHVNKRIGEIFNDTNGYFGARINAYTITLTYKNRGLVGFEVKRKRDDTHGYIIKQVIIEKDFENTETSIQAVKDRFAKENGEEWRFYAYNTLDEMVDLLKLIIERYPDKNAQDRMKLVNDLYLHYWNAEEKLHESN